MAITCPGCRREYDVTLFQLGRTIHCTCGRRVGLEHRMEIPTSADRPRFIADAMLGRLARWLRTLGYDTAHDDAIQPAPAGIVRIAPLWASASAESGSGAGADRSSGNPNRQVP